MAMVVKKILRSVYVTWNGIKFTTIINLQLIIKLIRHFRQLVHRFGSHFVNNCQPNVKRLVKYLSQRYYYQIKFTTHRLLLSWSSLEPLISLDLVSTKLYCFGSRVHCYFCLCIIFLANPLRRCEELRGDPIDWLIEWLPWRVNSFFPD